MKKILSFFSPVNLIATCFYVGKIPFMPGTWGSLAGVFFILLIFFQPHLKVIQGELTLLFGSGIIKKELILPFLVGYTIMVSILGIWASEAYEKKLGKKDPGEVVIDEVAGIAVAFSCIALVYALLLQYRPIEFAQILMASPLFVLVIFILFRIFDIAKPLHIGWAQDKFSGGLGIMLDDLIAGVYTAITFYILFFIARYFGFFSFYFNTFFTQS